LDRLATKKVSEIGKHEEKKKESKKKESETSNTICSSLLSRIGKATKD